MLGSQTARVTQLLSRPPQVVLPGVEEVARVTQLRLVVFPDVPGDIDLSGAAIVGTHGLDDRKSKGATLSHGTRATPKRFSHL